MCGVAGFVGAGSRDDLLRMSNALQHRGPDAREIWLDPAGGIGLAHTRLSVLDHEGGAQPMWLADRSLCVVFNGEIYNFVELRRELILRGCSFNSDHSDTEVLLHAYREWGDAFVHRLNGMWAFVLVDFRKRRLLASRDRFGKKPFYYSSTGKGLVFASELGALCQHHGVDAQVNSLAVKKYLAYGYIPAPLTPYRNIFKLPAGHQLVYQLDQLSLDVTEYWRFSVKPENPPIEDENTLASQLLLLLDDAVGRRLVADVPVGTFLSGGIDSSLVSALAARRLGGRRLQTFSIGFDEPSFDESAHARAMSNYIGSEHHEHRFRVGEASALAKSIAAKMADPFADASLLPTYLVSQIARSRVTVVLGGDGADELFAGYGPFQALRWAKWLSRVCPQRGIGWMKSVAEHLPVSHEYMSLGFKLNRALTGVQREQPYWPPTWMGPVNVGDVNSWVNDGVVHSIQEIYSEALASWQRCASDDSVDKTLEFFTRIYMQNDILAKVDQASMLNSLEVRSPFLDIEVAKFVSRIPSTLKLRGGTTKYLLRQAASGLLPAHVLKRRKQGFSIPLARWLASGELTIEADKIPAVIDRSLVTKCMQRHREGRSDESLALWAILALGELQPSKLAV